MTILDINIDPQNISQLQKYELLQTYRVTYQNLPMEKNKLNRAYQLR